MKLTFDRAALLKALDPASRVVERRNTIPILANILLTAQGDQLRLKATDLDIELHTSFPAQVETEGAITVPAARIHDIVRKLPDGCQITLEQKSGSATLALRSGRSRFEIQTLPAEDFPDITAGELPVTFAMPAATLVNMVARCEFAISTEETRYYLNGIYLHATEMEGEPTLFAVATDGHRLARFRMAAPEGAAQMPGIIIPRKTVAQIKPLVDKARDDVTVSLSPTKIRFTLGDTVLTSKLIDGTFPDYQRVIPANNERLVTLDSPLLAAAAARVATISGERGRAVKLGFSDAGLLLSVTNPDSGSAEDQVDCDWQGSPLDIGFNASYLAEALAVIGGATVQLKLSEPGSPTIIQAREDSDLLTVLMPMRV